MNDRDGLANLEHRLHSARPVPSPAFRGELRRRLLGLSPDSPPARLRLMIAAYASSGAALLLVVAVGVAGAGPFAA